jgi:hypothetical protein
MQQCTPLLLDLFPRDSLHFAGLNIMQAAHDLLLPGCVDVLINGCIQTGVQITSQFSPFVLRQGQSLLQQFMGFLGHILRLCPPLQLDLHRVPTVDIKLCLSGVSSLKVMS